MLVIGRKRDEKLIIDGRIEITVLKVGRNYVKFGIDAPREVPIRATLAAHTPSGPPAAEAASADRSLGGASVGGH